MENRTSEQYIKEENDNEQLAEVYCIKEEPDQNGETIETYLHIPKNEEHNRINETSNSNVDGDGEYLYDHLFLGKEEVQEPDTTGYEEAFGYEHFLLGKDDEHPETKDNENELIDVNFDEEKVGLNSLDYDSQNSAEQGEIETIQKVCLRNVMLLCPFCGTEYSNPSEWRKHINAIHKFHRRDNLNMEYSKEDKSKAKCQQCNLEVSSRLLCLQQHKIAHLPYSRYVKCKFCGKCFIGTPSAIYHLKTKHISSILYKKDSVETTSNNVVLLCPYCGIEFPNSSEWREHLNSIHEFNKHENLNIEYCSNDKAECQQCKLKIPSGFTSMQRHKISHLPYNRYIKCLLCLKDFISMSTATYHFKVQHNSRIQYKVDMSRSNEPGSNNVILLCPFCGTEFAKSSEWRRHLNSIHGFNKRINLNIQLIDPTKAKCLQCQTEVAATLSTLQTHKITHLPYNRYHKCKLCEKVYSSNSQLSLHLTYKHNNNTDDFSGADAIGEKDVIYLCPYCGVEYSNIFTWRQHLNTLHDHNKRDNVNMEFYEDKTAKCKQCQLKIDTKSFYILQEHRITHLPYNNYMKCKLCNKDFKRAHNFRYHLNKEHNRYMKNKQDAPREIETKLNNLILLCPFCGTEYRNSSAWRKHLNDVHEFDKRETLNMEICDDKSAKCKQCNVKTAATLRSLQRHRITHLPYNLFNMCKFCYKTYTSSVPIMSHKTCGQKNKP